MQNQRKMAICNEYAKYSHYNMQHMRSPLCWGHFNIKGSRFDTEGASPAQKQTWFANLDGLYLLDWNSKFQVGIPGASEAKVIKVVKHIYLALYCILYPCQHQCFIRYCLQKSMISTVWLWYRGKKRSIQGHEDLCHRWYWWFDTNIKDKYVDIG